MRPVPVALSGFDGLPFECQLRFHRRLRNVRLVPADALTAETATVPAPQPKPAPPPPPAPAAPTPTDTTRAEADAARERQQDRERLEAALDQVRTAVADLRKDRASRLQDWQTAAVELALTIATRLLHERVASGDFAIDGKVRDMIVQLGDDVPVTVRLNPTDLELLRDRMGSDPLSGDYADPRFVADPALTRGACQVEGRESMLMSDVASELTEIRDEMLRRLGDAGV